MSSGGDKWTALVLAGQRPGIDRLASHFGEEWKAQVRIAGTPMVERVIATLCAVPEVARIVVLAQDRAALGTLRDGRIVFAESRSGISESLRAAAGGPDAPWPVLVTTADHPLLTPEIVSAFLGAASDCDLAVGMVERATLIAAYPGNQRTWLKFRDGHWSGANLFALRSPKVTAALELWAKAEQDRKTAWKLFLHFGPWLCLRALTRTIGLGEGLARAGARLGLIARLVDIPFAEAGIDVDKPSDHVLAEAILLERENPAP